VVNLGIGIILNFVAAHFAGSTVEQVIKRGNFDAIGAYRVKEAGMDLCGSAGACEALTPAPGGCVRGSIVTLGRARLRESVSRGCFERKIFTKIL